MHTSRRLRSGRMVSVHSPTDCHFTTTPIWPHDLQWHARRFASNATFMYSSTDATSAVGERRRGALIGPPTT
jgi:hypothetical protein